MAEIDDLRIRLASVKELRASGVTMLQHGEVRTQYGDLAAVQASIEREIAAFETTPARKRRAFTAG